MTDEPNLEFISTKDLWLEIARRHEHAALITVHFQDTQGTQPVSRLRFTGDRDSAEALIDTGKMVLDGGTTRWGHEAKGEDTSFRVTNKKPKEPDNE